MCDREICRSGCAANLQPSRRDPLQSKTPSSVSLIVTVRRLQPRNYLSGQVPGRHRSRHVQRLKAQPGHDVTEDSVYQRELHQDAQYGAPTS
jgi:hypothetical protein